RHYLREGDGRGDKSDTVGRGGAAQASQPAGQQRAVQGFFHHDGIAGRRQAEQSFSSSTFTPPLPSALSGQA
ncbi:MAG: hypothetical protein ACE5GT_13860, partial [Rhodospirillales bacterium]